MKTKVIKIGNSKGIMLSKQLIQQYRLEAEVEIVPQPEGIFIKPVITSPRGTWEKQFEEAIENNGAINEDELLEGFENEFDKDRWKW